MIFAQMLTNIMNEKKISAYKMSKETGISDSLIGYWKKGERVPNAENLILISNYLEVTIDYLLTGKCNEPNNILSEDKKRFLSMYELLTDMEKGEILGEMKNMIKNKSSETKKENVS